MLLVIKVLLEGVERLNHFYSLLGNRETLVDYKDAQTVLNFIDLCMQSNL